MVRTAHLLAYTNVLRRLGAPLESELRRARLPTLLDEQPDAYIPVLCAMEFVQRLERKEAIDDLGFLAAQEETIASLSADFVQISKSFPTLYGRFRLFSEFVIREQTHCRSFMIPEGDTIRFVTDFVGPRLTGLPYTEWLQIAVMIQIVQQAVGSYWSPSEITFQTRVTPGQSAFEQFPNTRFLLGAKHTSITLPAWLLHKPLHHHLSVTKPVDYKLAPKPCADFPEQIKLMVRAYISEPHLDIDLVAEIIGTSARTLQRRLAQFELTLTWSSILIPPS